MPREMLPPLFQILMGLSGFALIAIRFKAASAFKPLWGRLAAAAILPLFFALFALSLATGARSIGAGAEMFAAAGAAMFLSVLLLGAALFASARGKAAPKQETGQEI